MHDIESLELQWKKYRSKKMRPWYLLILFLVLIGAGSFLFSNKNTFKMSWFNFDIKSKLNLIKYKEKSHLIMNDALMELSTEKEATLQAESSLEKEDTLVDIPLLEVSEKQDVVSPVEKKRKKVHLDIIKTNKIDAYRDVEKRFSLSHDIDDALFLAKSFYKKARYKKSEYWAYEVNKIDNNNVESILIFVKSKVKLGKRNEAISILNDYVKRTNLNEAKILLRKIEKHQL